MFLKGLGVNLIVVDVSDLFLGWLENVDDLEKKCKIIGNIFINVFDEEVIKLEV